MIMREKSSSKSPFDRVRIAAALLVLLGACTSVGPDYETPKPPTPAEWRDKAESPWKQGAADLAAWWRKLEDPVLDSLVDRAVSGSLDLREALARVRESRALRGAAAADRYPTIDARASYERGGLSEATEFGKLFPSLGSIDTYSAGFDAAWEIDLWGRVRRTVEAADADLEASIEDARAAAVIVVAETASSYVDLRAFQQRLALARTNVALQEQTLALTQTRFDAGLVGEGDVAQAARNLETTRAFVPTLEYGLRATENRLSVLLGLAPGELAAELASVQPIPVPPTGVAVGVPADLVRRRADIRRAERELAAETARIGVREGDLYPRLSLLGRFGGEAEDAGDVFSSEGIVFGFGPALRWNLFDGGRLRGRADAQAARAEQSLVRWERVVLAALEETENAMTGFVREQQRQHSLSESASHARVAVEVARSQYTEGLSDFQPVLDSQRSLALIEDELAQSDAAVTTRLVGLYKSLGGGWESEEIVARTESR
jgi:NodT family efflux transporter outer membrane factor (OMF) lipoprotein